MIVADKLEAQLAQLPGLPVKVAKWEIERGPDATNEPAVWVWMTLADWPEFAVRQQAREMIGDYVRDKERVDYVYVRFQSADEVA